MKLRARARYVPTGDAQERAAALVVPAMDRLGARIIDNARGKVNVRSGALRSSLRYRVRRVGSRVRLRVSANTPYARFVHDGTRPHAIYPRRAKALRFYWPRVGRVVYRKRVWHPGYRGNPFLRDAVAEELSKGNIRVR